MTDSPEFRMRLASALREEFPSAKLVDSGGEVYVIFTIVDYVPGCLPDCHSFRTYRNWSCEIMMFNKQHTPILPFNVKGSTYNPWFDPGENCIREFARYVRPGAASNRMQATAGRVGRAEQARWVFVHRA